MLPSKHLVSCTHFNVILASCDNMSVTVGVKGISNVHVHIHNSQSDSHMYDYFVVKCTTK